MVLMMLNGYGQWPGRDDADGDFLRWNEVLGFFPFYILGIYGRQYEKLLFHCMDNWKAVPTASVVSLVGVLGYSTLSAASYNNFDKSSFGFYTQTGDDDEQALFTIDNLVSE